MALNTAQHVETAALAPKKRKARWNIETRLRDALMVRAVMILADKETSHNAVCKASALLVKAEAQNQKDEQRKKKHAPKKDIPVVRRGWDEQEAPEAGNREQGTRDRGQESGVRNQESETKSQEAGETITNGRVEPSIKAGRKKRARRWNIKPEYRDLMVLRWSRIVADPKASQTALFAVGALMMRAEAQNQKDEEYRRKNRHRYPKQIVVEFTRDFYGNNAHELAAARAAAASSASSGVAGAKEDRDLRPEVKQDAVKAGRLGPQLRSATGPPAGGG